MSTIREEREKFEKQVICSNGVCACDSKGRLRDEEACSIRTCFQQDIDRITYSKAFRRLKQKTQVYLVPKGDHYRTRLTHTLEVTRIARTIARALHLNEDLAEAIGLGHDLGHTPFGHAGERALNTLMESEGGFRHYEQSLRVVDTIEKDGAGLNLSMEVRDGIFRHTCDPLAATVEGQIVRLADKTAYINHDVDDAIRAGTLKESDLPKEVREVLGTRYSARIDTIVSDIIRNGCENGTVFMSEDVKNAVDIFHDFLYDRVYKNPIVKGEERKVLGMLERILTHYVDHPEEMPSEFMSIAYKDGVWRAAADYVSCMTDSYALYIFDELFVPMAWTIR